MLGSGPAGMLAALAALQSGHSVVVLAADARTPSKPQGAQYLHQHIPGLTKANDPDFMVKFVKRGQRDVYAEKVYGNRKAPCSWDEFEGECQAWDLHQSYERIWMLLIRYTQEYVIKPNILGNLLPNFDMVLSTIPAPVICCAPKAHEFKSSTVYVTSRLPRYMPIIRKNTIVYNGVAEDEWYRASNIQGNISMESKGHFIPGSVAIKKPLGMTCDCWSGSKLVRLGRYGAWKKGQLVHHAYLGALEACRAL